MLPTLNGLNVSATSISTSAVQGIADHLQFSASYEPHERRRAEALAGYAWPCVAIAINDMLLSNCRTGRSCAAEKAEARGAASLPA